jgi:single-strand DNA-binding protein
MPAYNRIILAGHLTRDPETKETPASGTVTKFGIAVNHKYKTKGGEAREDVCFADCTAWGKTGETIAQWCKKGKAILVEGRLVFHQWEDKEGNRRSKHEVVVDGFQFLGGKEQAEPDPARVPSYTVPASNPNDADIPF